MLTMHWNSLAEFLAMGSHGLYVWGSLGVMAFSMLAEPIVLLQGRKKLVTRLKRQYRAERAEARRNGEANGDDHFGYPGSSKP